MKQIYEYSIEILAYLGKDKKNVNGLEKNHISKSLDIKPFISDFIIDKLHDNGYLKKYGYGNDSFSILPTGEILLSYKDYRDLVKIFPPIPAENYSAELEKHKTSILQAIKEFGIEREIPWNSLAVMAKIPAQYSEDIKDILCDDGLIVKTRSAQFMGDLVKGMPSITKYLLGIKKEIPIIQQVINMADNSTKIFGDQNLVTTAKLNQGLEVTDLLPAAKSIKQPIKEQKNITAKTIIFFGCGILVAKIH